MPTDRTVYNITPPREIENHTSSSTKHNAAESSTSSTSIDMNNVSDVAKLLKARLQYAQIKVQTGMSTEDLQQIERAFLSSPRQPRRPLPSEFPPTPASSSPHSRRVKRLLLSAMTPTQNSWRKKKRIREQKQNELIEDEAAARTILMLSSSSPSSSSVSRQQPTVTTTSPPHDTTSSAGSVSSPEELMHRRSSLHMYSNFEQPLPSDDIYDAVSNVPNYEEHSKHLGQALSNRAPQENTNLPPPPPAIALSDQHQQIQYNKPLPDPHLHAVPNYYKPPPPPMFGRPLSEDPFHSRPLHLGHVSSSRHSSTSPPSPPLSKK